MRYSAGGANDKPSGSSRRTHSSVFFPGPSATWSLFQTRNTVGLVPVALGAAYQLASMEPPLSNWHTSGAVAVSENGPVGVAAVAAPMHCRLTPERVTGAV